MILKKYRINKNTIALLPSREIDFDTIVLEKDRKLKVKKTSIELLNTACMEDWTTYEGRRKAIIHHTSFQRKVPILVDIRSENYFLPTHSPTSIYNKWFSYQHIAKVKENTSHPNKTDIIFLNGIELCVNVSHHLIDRQMQRTFECIYRMRRGINKE